MINKITQTLVGVLFIVVIITVLALVFEDKITGYSKNLDAQTEDVTKITKTKEYADAVTSHALSVSAQIKIINKDLASTSMDNSLKAMAVETNASILRAHLGEARHIAPPEHLKDLHGEYLSSLEKINEGLTYFERWAESGDSEILARGQNIIAEGMSMGSSFANQLKSKIQE